MRTWPNRLAGVSSIKRHVGALITAEAWDLIRQSFHMGMDCCPFSGCLRAILRIGFSLSLRECRFGWGVGPYLCEILFHTNGHIPWWQTKINWTICHLVACPRVILYMRGHVDEDS